MISAGAIYTLGHAGHTMERFLELLETQGIKLVVDIRSSPFSAFSSHFCKKPLEDALAAAGKDYVFKGQWLGGRMHAPLLSELGLPLNAGREEFYAALRECSAFQQEIEHLLEQQRQGTRLALLCGEEDPSRCHRRLLVSRALEARGAAIWHLRADGSLQSEQVLVALCAMQPPVLRPKSPMGM